MTEPNSPPVARQNIPQSLAHRGSLKGFLSLSEEASLSTRGQHLPSLIQRSQGLSRNHSASTLHDLRKNPLVSPKKRSNGSSGLYASTSVDDMDLELGRSKTLEDGRHTGMDGQFPRPPTDFPFLSGMDRGWREQEERERKGNAAPNALVTPEMRSQRLIGNNNPRYRWEQYYKTDAELKEMRKPIRKYYERNNYLIQQYIYIDRLLDSSLPHNLIQEYAQSGMDVPPTILEEPSSIPDSPQDSGLTTPVGNGNHSVKNSRDTGIYTVKVKRTPRDIYKIPDEDTPLLNGTDKGDPINALPTFIPEDEDGSGDKVVAVAIYLNLAANSILLILKIIVTVLTSSLSVLASLVDAALDFLSTAIVWTTTHIISRDDNDRESYPVGRQRLEPIGVLVFAVIMITSFFQVGLEAVNRLRGDNHEIVQLTIPAIAIMTSTVLIKAGCWLWCRLIRNSSVQALAQDAVTDVVFNIFSIIFPLVGYYARIWWLDPLGGLLLSGYVIFAWSLTTRTHIANLTGHAATKDERNILLYLTMRFAKTINYIQVSLVYSHSSITVFLQPRPSGPPTK